MDRAEFIATAAPPCHKCGFPVERVEMHYGINTDFDWVPKISHMVCGNEHRVRIELLDEPGDA